MKKIKRFTAVISVVLCMCILCCSSVFAQENDTKIFNQEISSEQLLNIVKEKDGLYNNLQNGLITLKSEIIKQDDLTTIEKIESKQLLSKQKISNNNTIDNYVSTCIYTLSYDGSKEDVGSDRTGSVTIKVRVFYERKNISNKYYLNITNVTTSVSKPSPIRNAITDASLFVGQSGFTNGGFKTQSKKYNAFGDSNITWQGGSYSVVPPVWVPVIEDSTSDLGATLYVTLKDRANPTNTWTDSVVCSVL